MTSVKINHYGGADDIVNPTADPLAALQALQAKQLQNLSADELATLAESARVGERVKKTDSFFSNIAKKAAEGQQNILAAKQNIIAKASIDTYKGRLYAIASILILGTVAILVAYFAVADQVTATDGETKTTCQKKLDSLLIGLFVMVYILIIAFSWINWSANLLFGALVPMIVFNLALSAKMNNDDKMWIGVGLIMGFTLLAAIPIYYWKL